MKTRVRFLGIFLWLCLIGGWARVEAQDVMYVVDKQTSTIRYEGSHFLHDWEGVSQNVDGQLIVNEGGVPLRATARVAVEDFDSGNSSRDSNMMSVMQIDRYPDVLLDVQEIAPTADASRWAFSAQLTMHGQTHPMLIPVTMVSEGDAWRVSARFDVSLSRHGVDRPALFAVKIDDQIAISVDLLLRATP